MSIKITINLSFYNQIEVLKKHILKWKSYPNQIKEKYTFCIIDDCSKINALEVLKGFDLSDLDIHIYRVEEDLYCNIAGVRNLAASECKTEWMIILDMDTLVSIETAQAMIDLVGKYDKELFKFKSKVFKFNRRVPSNLSHPKQNQIHPAVCLIRKKDYWDIGGCEEDLVGNYGYTDPSFWSRAKGRVKIKEMQDIFLDYDPEGESNIIRNTEVNARLFQQKIANGNWSKDFIRFKWCKIF